MAPLRSRRWILLLGVGLVLVTAILFATSRSSSSAEGELPNAIPYEDATTWGREVAAGKHPVLVRRDRADENPTATEAASDGEDAIAIAEGRSLGQLEGSDYTRLLRACTDHVEFLDNEYSAFREAMDLSSPEDLAKEADQLEYRELAIVTRDAVSKGNYFVVTQETANMILSPPPNYAKTTFSCRKDGKHAIAVIMPSYDDYPVLAHVREYRKQANLWALEELVREFNGSPYTTRRSKVDRYIEIRSKTERTDDDRAFLRATFPSGVRIDEHKALLHVIR